MDDSPAAELGKPLIKYDDFAKLDLRVARIVDAAHHPNADRLLKLRIDLGGQERQICAGIRDHYEPETLVGTKIIVVANLEPRKIRGEASEGMLLAASAADGDEPVGVVLLEVPDHVPAGSSVG